ncbi:MAG: amidohydrolase family protein [Actinomycetota bacterium]
MSQAPFDTLIAGGLIVDGTGAPAYYGDVGVRAGRIAEIGRLGDREAARRIDATGRIVAPGHITQHTHYDAALFWDPYCLDAAHNGVTTVANANCGFGFAPVRARDAERTMLMMSTTEQIPVEHQRAAMPWDWESFPDWMTRLRALPKGVNVATYLPLNPLLVYVMGVDAAKTRAPDAAEMSEIHRLINEAMDAGAIGISMSVMGAAGNSHVDYDGTSMPTDAMDHDALLEIGRAVVERGEGVIQMLSQIAFFGDRSITERMAELAKGSGVRVVHNVFLTSDIEVMADKVTDDLAWLDAQRAEGRDLTVGALVNRGWVEADIRQLDTAAGQLAGVRRIVACADDDELRQLLADADFVRTFGEEYASADPSNGAAAFEGQTIIGVGDGEELRPLLGRTLADVAEERGSSVIEVMCSLALETDLALQLKSPPIGATTPDQAVRLLSHAGVIGGGSDGGAHTKSFGMGHYATDLLIWLVRETNAVTLEDLHFQLSLKTARSIQIHDRGALLRGYWADVLVYDLDDLHFDLSCYDIVHDMPQGDWRRQGKAGGYEYILVNGEVTHERDASNGETPGQVVRVTSAALAGADA